MILPGYHEGKVYVFYDRPVLFSCWNQDGHFLAEFADEKNEYEEWILAPISTERLQKVEIGNIFLREVYTKSEAGYVIRLRIYNDDSNKVTSEMVYCHELNEDELPGKNAHLKDR